MKPRRLKERFEEKVIPEPMSGCWIWTDLCHYSGYGHFKVQNKTVRAHRASWMIYRGVIPDGMLVCHKCDRKWCCNPEHLFLGTPKDNMVDKVNKKRHFFRDKLCKYGHELSDKNLYIRLGRRECRTCINIRATKRKIKPTEQK